MSAAAWTELGIEPTRDARAIRRAYATRLKQTRPETDPDGFTRLRAALETALRLAEGGAVRTQPAATFRPTAHVDVTTGPTPPDPEAHIHQLAGAGRTTEAADALAQAIDHGTLSLAAEMVLKDRLLQLLVHDRSLRAVRLAELARQLGWLVDGSDTPGAGDGTLMRDFEARLSAERWYDALVQTAASRRYVLGDEPAAAARLLLGQGDPLARLLPPCLDLKKQLSLYRFHRRWIENRFDAAVITAHEKMAERPYPGRLARLIWRLLQSAAIIATFAVSTMLLLAVALTIPYCRIQGYSRAGMGAYAAIAMVLLALSAVLPAGIVFLIISGGTLDPGAPVWACTAIGFCCMVALKQLFLPGRRVR